MLDWDGTSEDVRAALLEFALTRGGVDSLDTWAASLSNESKALLARSGFEPAQPELRARGLPCVLLKRLGKATEWELGGAPAVAPSRWDIRLMDSMTG